MNRWLSTLCHIVIIFMEIMLLKRATHLYKDTYLTSTVIEVSCDNIMFLHPFHKEIKIDLFQ